MEAPYGLFVLLSYLGMGLMYRQGCCNVKRQSGIQNVFKIHVNQSRASTIIKLTTSPLAIGDK